MDWNEKYWNRCEYCGQFIAHKDLDGVIGDHLLVTPDTDFTVETYETFHYSCKFPGRNLE